ncbi:MAG TPA: hypothetical protein VER04_17430, partial [Polyangiaceae bacterium]|nr:hypothetical protein [Polyangiaceae bacterium]
MQRGVLAAIIAGALLGACSDNDRPLEPAGQSGATGSAGQANLAGAAGESSSDPCVSGQVKCDARCVSVSSDPENCGECGTQCETGEVCSQGRCALTCGGGTSKCDTRCADLNSDPSNCGACGDACDAGEVCS